jgi:DNA replication initiation complex subunit (GINS family)
VELWCGAGMKDELSYDILWQTYQKEKLSNELQLIPRTFYEDMKEFINSSFGKEKGEEGQVQKENATRLLYNIFERRKQKIIIYAAYGKSLPNTVSTQEAAFYEKILKVIKETTVENIPDNKIEQIALKSLQNLPEILLPSGRKVGPLEKEQIIEVKNKEDTNFLINNGICKPI